MPLTAANLWLEPVRSLWHPLSKPNRRRGQRPASRRVPRRSVFDVLEDRISPAMQPLGATGLQVFATTILPTGTNTYSASGSPGTVQLQTTSGAPLLSLPGDATINLSDVNFTNDPTFTASGTSGTINAIIGRQNGPVFRSPGSGQTFGGQALGNPKVFAAAPNGQAFA